MDIIEAKGRGVAESLVVLRSIPSKVKEAAEALNTSSKNGKVHFHGKSCPLCPKGYL